MVGSASPPKPQCVQFSVATNGKFTVATNTVKSGLSGEVVRQAVDVVGHRELFARLLGTTTGNLSRLYRRKTLEEGASEALLDVLRVVAGAVAAFGALAQADEWLDTKIAALGGQRPIDLCDTFEGRGLVRGAIRKIEDGEFP